ncbi:MULTISPECIES: hypothetical protein [Kitasatospora]|uniref:Uncharacterized protein n=1 Tax=Kitasatospora cathayae TaxID=3004092 RepID=A0ABY7PWZ5_9ACTN|nr:hypothetical protein [Kitasatospora sp. HUAS 3-15]WBP84896.1 hypothetical protein O1G21_02865 [Kitasatospora sp. HUAS 3-15]
MMAALFRTLGRIAARHHRSAHADRAECPEPRPTVTWEEAERLTTAALLTGLIDRAEYRDHLALLAAVEDARSPLRLPLP